jgi:hypothetical protein
MFEINPYKKKEQRETGKQGVERAFVKACTVEGWKAFKFTSENNRGVSDRLVLTPGQVWFVELKRTSGKLTPLQIVFRDLILHFGLNHFVVYGKSDIKKFKEKVYVKKSN